MAAADGLTSATARRPGRREAVGVGMCLVAALMFALNGVFSKAAMNAGLDPVRLTELRNAGAMVVLVVYVGARHRERFRIAKGELGFLAVYGVIAYTLVQFLYYLTISRLTVGIGTLFVSMAPVVVALYLKAVRRRDVSDRIWIAIALTVGGLAMVAQVWQGFSLDPLGVVAGVGVAFVLAAYWMLGEKGQERRDAVSLSMWGFVFATLAWSVVAPWWSFPWTVLAEPTELSVPGGLGLPVWSLMTWVVLLGTVVPFLLVLGSLKRIGSQRAGIVATTEPLWAALIALALLAETFAPVQAAGGLIVLVGIVVAETSRRSPVVEQHP